MNHYRYAGVVIETSVELELPATSARGDAPLVVLRRADEPVDDRVVDQPRFDRFVVRGHQGTRAVAVGRVSGRWVAWLPPYLTADLGVDVIEIAVAPDVDARLVNEHVVGNVLPFWLAVSGRWAFHGCAVWRPDVGAVAMLGPTHVGKSTSAAALVAAGWRLVADDTVTGVVVDGVVRLDTTSDTVHLRAGARRLAESPGFTPCGDDPEGRLVARVPHADGAVDLRGVLFLDRGASTEAAGRRLAPPMVLKHLLDNSRVGAWVDVEFRAAEFDVAASLADLVPAYRAAVADAFADPPAFAAYVERIMTTTRSR